jgi:lysophospholipase L1-like esterase
MTLLMTFGDSNSYGTPPMDSFVGHNRFSDGVRWPTVAAGELGWQLIEQGLPGRTAQFDDPIMGKHMNGQDGLKIALESNGPIDVLTIMLGTNDVKARFASNPYGVMGGIASLLDIALSPDMQDRHAGYKVLLICPPPVVEVGILRGEFYGGATMSAALPPLYRALADARGVGYLDAGQVIKVSALDGVHFDAPDHAVLGRAVAQSLSALV